MNKYLLMSAAAVLGTSAGAVSASAAVDRGGSGQQSVYFVGSFSGGTQVTFCDAMTLAWAGKVFYADLDNEHTFCGFSTGDVGGGQGIAGSSHGIGHNVDVSNSIVGSRGLQLNFDFSLNRNNPQSGLPATIWYTYSSSFFLSSFEGYAGHYYFGVPAHNRKGPALTKEVKTAMKAHLVSVKK